MALDITSVLQDAAGRTPAAGQATVAPGDGRIAGTSTGEGDTQRAAWFAGYTEQVSTAVTMFRSKPGRPLLPTDGTGGDGSVHGSAFPADLGGLHGGVSLVAPAGDVVP
ncbi:hypothetical protein [Streptomyces sp. NPDC001970]